MAGAGSIKKYLNRVLVRNADIGYSRYYHISYDSSDRIDRISDIASLPGWQISIADLEIG